jgi:hypothetical protein
VEITVKKEYLGHTFELNFRSSVDEDLTKFEVEQRLQMVLSRELQRCAEVSVVGLKDKLAAEGAAALLREQKASGTVPVKGPAQFLAAGTKDPAGRVVVEG